MKGYVYISPDGEINVRDKNYIDNHDPGFFGNNRQWIACFWEFDSEDIPQFETVLEGFARNYKNLRIRAEDVQLFCKAVGFDLEASKKRRNSGKTPEKSWVDNAAVLAAQTKAAEGSKEE